MSTSAQIEANRANATHSTGPKSEAGKEISSRNNTRHGLSGEFVVLPHEDAEEFQRLLNNLKEAHQPADGAEESLVVKMAEHYWTSQRALALQNDLLLEGLTKESEKRLDLYLRYQTTHDRAFSRCLSDLLKLRNDKRKAEIGFESQKRREAEELRREAAEKRREASHAAAEQHRDAAEARRIELHKPRKIEAEKESLAAQRRLEDEHLLDHMFRRNK